MVAGRTITASVRPRKGVSMRPDMSPHVATTIAFDIPVRLVVPTSQALGDAGAPAQRAATSSAAAAPERRRRPASRSRTLRPEQPATGLQRLVARTPRPLACARVRRGRPARRSHAAPCRARAPHPDRAAPVDLHGGADRRSCGAVRRLGHSRGCGSAGQGGRTGPGGHGPGGAGPHRPRVGPTGGGPGRGAAHGRLRPARRLHHQGRRSGAAGPRAPERRRRGDRAGQERPRRRRGERALRPGQPRGLHRAAGRAHPAAGGRPLLAVARGALGRPGAVGRRSRARRTCSPAAAARTSWSRTRPAS
jgi:hypothetical protein